MIDAGQARRWLWMIIALAILLRVAAACYLGDRVQALPGTADQVSYDTLAWRVATGHGFTFATDWWPATRAGEPTAHWSFLYTLYLAGVYAVVGHHPLIARLVQAIATGLLMPWLAYRLGRRLFGPLTGLAAAALMAVYAYFIYYSATLMTEPFYITAILWALDCGLRIWDCGLDVAQDRKQTAAGQKGEGGAEKAFVVRSASLILWVELGLALGMAALLRQVILLFVPFLLTWLWWATRLRITHHVSRITFHASRFTFHVSRFTPYALRFLCTLIVIAALIAPWTVRNYRAFGRFVLLNTNAGFAFFWANHPIYGTHFVGILPPNGPSYQDLIPPELRHLDEAALDRALLREGLRFVIEDPVRYVLLSLSRVREYFKFWPSANSSLPSNVARTLSFGLLLPFTLYGLVLSVVRRPSSIVHPPQPAVILLWLFIAVYTLIHLLSWSLIRYRLPVDAVLLIFAGLALADVWKRLARWVDRVTGRWGDRETRRQGDKETRRRKVRLVVCRPSSIVHRPCASLS